MAKVTAEVIVKTVATAPLSEVTQRLVGLYGGPEGVAKYIFNVGRRIPKSKHALRLRHTELVARLLSADAATSNNDEDADFAVRTLMVQQAELMQKQLMLQDALQRMQGAKALPAPVDEPHAEEEAGQPAPES